MSIKLRLVFLTLFSFSIAAGQNATWVSSIISEGYDDCHDLYADQSGNIYVTGQIEFTASFDGYNRSSYGSHDIFIARYDSLGNLIWAKHAGGTDGDIGYSIAVDKDGNVFTTGEFETTSNFGGISKTVQGSNNMFIAKYDSSGNSVWVKSIGTNSGSTIGYAIACDDNGNVYAAGITRARAIYNGSTLFSSRGSEDIILIKFNSDGDKMWHKQIGGNDSDEGFGLAVSGENVYLTGSFEGSSRFSSSVSLQDDGGLDFFLANYDTTGSLKWAVSGGGGGDDIGHDVTVNANGNIVCTGEFRGHASFGSNSVNSEGNSDMFVAAFDENGDNLWVQSGGGNFIDYGDKISCDNNGNLFIGGTYEDDADFDQVTVSSNGNEDVFLASYDSSGNFRFVKAFGGDEHDRGHGTGTDRYGNIYFAGEFRDEIDFDNLNINGDELWDGFIVRFGNLPCEVSLDSSVVNHVTCDGCIDGSIDISFSGGVPPYNFSWSDSITSEDRSNLPVGTYRVCISDRIGCIVCDSFDVILPNLGIYENQLSSMINVYPNPVQSSLVIHFDDAFPIEKYRVELNNNIGQELKTIPVSSKTLSLAMTEFSNGIYFLKISNKETGSTLRIIPLLLQKQD